MFQTKVVEKLETHMLCSIFFSITQAIYEIILKNYGTARQDTDENIVRRMRFAW